MNLRVLNQLCPIMKPILDYLSSQRWPALLWTFLIIVACTLPGKSLPGAPVVGFDKVVHIGMFVGWACLWMLLYPGRVSLLIVVGVVFGIALEFYQQMLPFDRTFDWWDALADGVGTVVGTVVFLVFSKIRREVYV